MSLIHLRILVSIEIVHRLDRLRRHRGTCSAGMVGTKKVDMHLVKVGLPSPPRSRGGTALARYAKAAKDDCPLSPGRATDGSPGGAEPNLAARRGR